jgi:glycosyltransferase involved in cell wall biosynthesis
MTIALIGSAHPLRGGLAAFNEHLAAQLQDQGYDVTIFSFSLQYPGFLFPGTTQYTDEPPPPGLRIRTMLNSINPLSWLRTGRAIARTKPDLVLIKFWLPFMGPAFGTVLRVVKKQSPKTRVLCIVDNLIPHEKRPGDPAFTRYFLKPVDAFVTMSRKVLDDLRHAAPTKPAAFTPHPLYDNYGATLAREEACRLLQLNPSKKYLLFFGFIRAYKGLDLLLEALQDDRLRDADIHCIVAGEFYEDAARYEALMADPRVAGRAHRFTQFIPTGEVARYFSAADLVVQPYRSATQSGITQIAYHFEKPMVVTDVGGLAEVVPDGEVGYVVQPEPHAIADGILKFFAEENAGERMRAAIRQEKTKYSWEEFIRVVMATAAVRQGIPQ